MKQKTVRQILPNCLRKYRRARGLRTKDVAAILGLTSGVVSRWESGVALPDTRNAIRLAALYRTIVDALFTDLVHDLKAELLARECRVLDAPQTRSTGPPPIDIESNQSIN